MMKCPPVIPVIHAEQLAAVEAEQAGYLAAHATVPGYEVHVESDATWAIQPGGVWGNCAVRLRLAAGAADKRLDRIADRYCDTERGGGFWLSPFATPTDLPARLRRRGFRCRKLFPAMYRDLSKPDASEPEIGGLTFQVVEDHDLFLKFPHPCYGPIRTPMRRFELARQAHMAAMRPRRFWDIVAFREGVPVGVCTLFDENGIAGVHDVGVLPANRRQGIGTALMRQACRFSRGLGAAGCLLISSGEGYGMYGRAGFREVGRIGYWYRRYRIV
jgi:ribosomal protein S18 acetylase RimI-like enzyme